MRLFTVQNLASMPLAEGVEFTDGSVAVRYRCGLETGSSFYASLGAFKLARLEREAVRFQWETDEGWRDTAGAALRWVRLLRAHMVECGFETPVTEAADEFLAALEAA